MLTPAGQPPDLGVLRASLVITWLSTVAVSAWECNGASLELLRTAGMTDRWAMTATIWLAITWDLVMGIAIWRRPGRWVYRATLAQVVAMSIAATWLLPSLWLAPLGPLTKNLPIVAILWFLERAET